MLTKNVYTKKEKKTHAYIHTYKEATVTAGEDGDEDEEDDMVCCIC
jgi:hypothetical protein